MKLAKLISGRFSDGTRGFYFHSGEGPNSVVDGFTICNGKGVNLSGGTVGGGILCENSSAPTIVNNIIMGNSADFGGGISCFESSPMIKHNTIVENTADL